MQTVNSDILITGSKEQVWQVISDLSSYHKWNSQLRLIGGLIEAGEKLKIRIKPLYYRSSKSSATIKDFMPFTRFGLKGISLIPGLLKVECLFTLSEVDKEHTSLHLHQRFYGLFAFLIDRRSYNIEARKSCFKMNAEARRRVEELLRPAEEISILSA